MKRETPSLLKFRHLQNALSETRRGTVGLLELLWIETLNNCPEGDIGRFSNADIAVLLDWPGDPDTLIEALAERSGWIDRSDEHRLIVHDWPDHCPNYLKANLTRWGKTFCVDYERQKSAKGTSTTDAPQCTDGGDVEYDKPSVACAPPINNMPSVSSVQFSSIPVLPGQVREVDWIDAVPHALKAELTIPAVTFQDAEFLLRSAYLSQSHFSENWFYDALEGVKLTGPANPGAYFRKCLAEQAGGLLPFNELLKSVPLPDTALQAFRDARKESV